MSKSASVLHMFVLLFGLLAFCAGTGCGKSEETPAAVAPVVPDNGAAAVVAPVDPPAAAAVGESDGAQGGAVDPNGPLGQANALCAEGKADGCLGAAAFYQKGEGTAVNLAQANTLYVKACDLGDPKGCFMAGGFAKKGTLGAVDDNIANMYFGKGCDLKDGACCVALGLSFGGPNGDDNQEQMRIAFEKACDLGAGDGCFMAGMVQEEGKGVEKNLVGAGKFYERGCEAKDGAACTNLGGLILGGVLGEKPDGPRAMDFLLKACEYGAPNGCGMLGLMLAQGKLIPQDTARGEKYLRQACAMGFPPACAMFQPPAPQ